jgi:hypothetical protein
LQQPLSVTKAALAKRDHRSGPIRVWERELKVKCPDVVKKLAYEDFRFVVISTEGE